MNINGIVNKEGVEDEVIISEGEDEEEKEKKLEKDRVIPVAAPLTTKLLASKLKLKDIMNKIEK